MHESNVYLSCLENIKTPNRLKISHSHRHNKYIRLSPRSELCSNVMENGENVIVVLLSLSFFYGLSELENTSDRKTLENLNNEHSYLLETLCLLKDWIISFLLNSLWKINYFCKENIPFIQFSIA